jgi:predicted nucleotidyltransferase
LNRYQPKDFIETAEGLIFAVVAADLEDQRVLCFLRYRRVSGGYQKLSTRDADELLKNHYPHYIYYSKSRDVTLHGVYCDLVAVHHLPRKRLQAICTAIPCDEIEEKLKRLVDLFNRYGLDSGEIGVTGSMLIGAQSSNSDIDLVFYRRKAFHKGRAIVKVLLQKRLLQPLDETLWRDAYERRGCSLTFDEYRWHEARKFNKAAIEQTKFDLSLLTPEVWQDVLGYKKLKRCNLQTRIDDDRHSFDYPARYILDHPSVKEAVSYTATYVGQAERGERVAIQGQLEVSAGGHLRIVIGSNREAIDEYIKVIDPEKK